MIDMDKLKSIISEIENTNDLKEIKKILEGYHFYDISQIINEVENDKKKIILSFYNEEELVEILSYLDDSDASEILNEIPLNEAASIINEMEIDNASDVLDEFDTEKASEIRLLLDKDVQEDLNELDKYDDKIAGSIMNLNYLKVYDYYDVKEAMKVLVSNAPDVEVINTLIVVNEFEELVGTLDFKKLIITKSPCLVKDIMLTHFEAVDVFDDIEVAISKINNYDLYLIPVTENKKIKGIITIDDAFDETIDAAEDDYAKFAGLTEDEDSSEKVKESIKKRIPWLIILLFLDFGVSFVISIFSKVIVAIPLLTFFQAAVLGLAGNSGTQSLAISVRKISDNELNNNKEIFKHLIKETLLGLLIGVMLGIVSFALVVGMLYLKKEVDIPPVKIAFVLGVSISLAVTVSNLFGSLIPIIFYKCHADPAVASGPFITTINDIIVVILYFGIALIMLSNYI